MPLAGGAENNGSGGTIFSDLSHEIEAERQTLESAASRPRVLAHPLKQAGAVVAERLSRFKIDHRAIPGRNCAIHARGCCHRGTGYPELQSPGSRAAVRDHR